MKACAICGQRSVLGLKGEHGYCRWHWASLHWGKSWAALNYGPEPLPPQPARK